MCIILLSVRNTSSIMWLLQFIGKVISSSALIFVVVVLVPGIPPDVEFEAIK